MNTSIATQILTHTPVWVYALLAGLIALGFQQSRRRVASLGRLMIAPLALSTVSLTGVVSGFGNNLGALLLWPLAAALATWLLLKRPSRISASYNPASKKFEIAGSWTPMLLFLSIFCIKYAVGVSLSLQPKLAQNMAFALPVSAVNGLISGLFISRALRWWRMAKAG